MRLYPNTLILHLQNKTIFRVILGIIYLICVFHATASLSKSYLPNTISIGVRTAAAPIAHVEIQAGEKIFSGFCYAFGQELKKAIEEFNPQGNVAYRDIENEYKGQKYPRYDGLKTNKINIECGPNSLPNNSSSDSINATDILFSNTFYTTGIKLLLKEDKVKNLSISSPEEKNTIKQLKIGVVDKTTTLNQLKLRAYDYPSIKNYETRTNALKGLEIGEVDAYASDAIILQTVLQRKTQVDGQKTYRENGYILFPRESKKYLTDQPEQYGIAIYQITEYAGELLSIINKVLEQPILKEDERKKLEKYESGEDISNEFSQSIFKRFKDNLTLTFGSIILIAVTALVIGTNPKARAKFSEALPEVVIVWIKRFLGLP